MKSLDEIKEESVSFRQKLETEKPGCTKHIAPITSKSTLDELLEEHTALKGMIKGTGANVSDHGRLIFENSGIRGALEDIKPGCTAKIEKANAIYGSFPTSEQFFAERGELLGALKKIMGSGVDADGLKAENTRLATENTNLREQVASFDTRLAQATAAEVCRLGFSDRHTNITTTKASDSGTELTATQKLLKAKGLPLNTKVQIGTPTPESIED
jgi:hypothetical protein